MIVQQTLPGFSQPSARRRRRRPTDPAISESRARADHQYADWREAFVGFLRNQPPHRRAELRRRIFAPASPPRRNVGHAA